MGVLGSSWLGLKQGMFTFVSGILPITLRNPMWQVMFLTLPYLWGGQVVTPAQR